VGKDKDKYVYNKRKDWRTDERFRRSIEERTKEEEKWAILWIDDHNDRRHKYELILMSWGNKRSGKFDMESDKVKKYCRPDYCVHRCADNSRVVRRTFPLEVQQCGPIYPPGGICYVKLSKIDWPYDDFTKEFCDEDAYFLFVMGTHFPGRAKYALLPPKFIKKIRGREVIYPVCMGLNPCVSFRYGEMKWKTFSGKGAQQRIDVSSISPKTKEYDEVVGTIEGILFKEGHKVRTNLRDSKKHGIPIGTEILYPALYVFEIQDGKRVVTKIYEVETEQTINDDETVKRWKKLANEDSELHLVVPLEFLDKVKSLTRRHGISIKNYYVY